MGSSRGMTGRMIIAEGRPISQDATRLARAGPAPVIVASPAGRYRSAMLPTMLFAALAGLLTVLSPCVLPVIPLLVGAADRSRRRTDRGGRRVAGLIVGFGAAFIAATVLLASTLAAAGVTTSQLRVASALLLVVVRGHARRPGAGPAGRALGKPGDHPMRGGDPSRMPGGSAAGSCSGSPSVSSGRHASGRSWPASSPPPSASGRRRKPSRSRSPTSSGPRCRSRRSRSGAGGRHGAWDRPSAAPGWCARSARSRWPRACWS